ncbi:deoxyribose-phosphate aldolase [Burkholderia alba]|uniref:deoxyribose-phosphate aldolase n=1 Tax=Burkholderia alba TaxID=2683677 RepID=UPI002B0572C1|nr:deoxyribose-phosphate aldolase [Burkholderia alba]
MNRLPTRNQIIEAALKALHLIDLTSLNDDDTDASIAALAASADTPVGTPAALCVYPRFVGAARAALAARGLALPIATVTNFPDGAADPDAAARETADAIALGADEVDVVFPYRALLAGDARVGRTLVEQARAASAGRCLKVILETGELRDAALIRRASEIAIEAGADFIKTSTGKVPVNATLDAAAAMLAAIRDAGRPVGFKAAGGVRSAEEAAAYLSLAEHELGAGYTVPATFRFGASSLLASLLETLGHGHGRARGGAY